ncbi:Beta-1,3-galactosyltransferase 5 [Thelohanellus kitauei]|uniref:Hexosyltransferase n=1 Tax=Thelohanellus kitauei TaxID=669202 RepID=A0A0C2II16_THEKT|nr:Beta-1,3-galactosyltransferase 5 [Thelohanellus kitauei]KII64990.1 Beta-1,3-galactosyltransferase 5 [Thelohanellus kitauei]
MAITSFRHGKNNFYDLDYFPSMITISRRFRAGPFPLNDSLIDSMVLHVKSVFDRNCNYKTELVVFVISDPKTFELREHIRSIYGKNSHYFPWFTRSNSTKEYCLLFSVGYTSDLKFNQRLDWEAYTRGDVIRVPLIESYRDIAHKIILTLFLLNKTNGSFQYILKVDDDAFIKMNKLLPYVRKLTEKQVLIGCLVADSPRIKDPKHKWYVSDLEYSGDVYKPYVIGFAEMFRRNIINRLAVLHSKTRLIPMEDIHFSYLVNKLGYNLTDEPRFCRCDDIIPCRNRFFVEIGKDIRNRTQMTSSIQSEHNAI